MYGRKVWSVNIKDVEWLTVQLADNSEEITNLERKIDKFEKVPIQTQNVSSHYSDFYSLNGKGDFSRYHQNNMKSLSPSHQLAYMTSKKHSDVT